MMKLLVKIFAILTIYSSVGCGTADKKAGQGDDDERRPKSIIKPQTKQLNLSVLWDLSDRIDTSRFPNSPQHYERDIEIIKSLSELFTSEMHNKGVHLSKGKIKVFFTPAPPNKQINDIADDLKIDLTKYPIQEAAKRKKEIYDTLTALFVENARKIYRATVEHNKGNAEWPGSDIWRFFDSQTDIVIEQDTSYRNILVIVSDGYIYNKDSPSKVARRSQYILPSAFQSLRSRTNWKQIFDREDYGLIVTKKDLANLEVLVLEVSPTKGNANDEYIIKAYLEKWFNEMGIKKHKIYTTALPTYTRQRIESFINGD